MKTISKLILKLLGWEIDEGEIKNYDRAVVIVAPHTSMMDFVIGRLAFYKFQLPVKFTIKKEMFWFPFGKILKLMGGFPIDRRSSKSFVEQVKEKFSQSEKFFLIITPEGTRNLNPQWKKGFYKIAKTVEVPIILTYIDYKHKKGGVGPILTPKGNYEEDFKLIEDFYKNVNAKYPEKFNLSKNYSKK